MTPRAVVILLAAAIGGCNAVAGIADFHEVNAFDAPDGGDAGALLADAARDGNNGSPADSGIDAPSVTDASAGGDAPDTSPPPCPSVALHISVVASPTGAYTGVDLAGPTNLRQSIPAGETRVICAALGDQIDLRGQPDLNSAQHKWDGTSCGIASRCKFTMTESVTATVYLE